MGHTTRIDRALRLTQRELVAPENGARPGIVKILILLTDGSQTGDNDAEDPGNIAEEIRQSGVKILVVGVGSGVDLKELDHMAGGKGKAFTAKSFDELIGKDFVAKLTAKSCDTAV